MATKEEFEAVYHQYSRMVFMYLYNKVSDYDLAQDLLQDTFLKYYRYLGKIEEEKMGAWLLTTAQRNCLDYWRTKAYRLTDTVEEVPQTATVIPQRHLEMQDWVQNLLSRLPQDLRQVFQFYVMEDWTDKEVASHLNMSERSVRRKAQQAKTLLRECLA